MRLALLLAGLIVLAVAAQPPAPARPGRPPAGGVAPLSTSSGERPAPAATPIRRAARPAAELPASLRGSEVDGDLQAGAGGFLADREALRLFDYFLSSLGEIDLAGVRRLVAGEAARRVPGHEAEVLALFDDYLGYLHALEGKRHAMAPREALAEVRRSQRERFGEPLAERLFGEADTLAEVILDEAEGVPGDHEARLPEAVRAWRARGRAPAEVRAEVERLRAAGAGEAAIWALRAGRFGPEAADRLAELDARRR